MSGKVEQVAENIFEDCAKRDWPTLLDKWETYDAEAKDRFRSMARAAIKGMREPTEAMMAAVDCAGEKRDWPSGKMHLESWQAMIDEALR